MPSHHCHCWTGTCQPLLACPPPARRAPSIPASLFAPFPTRLCSSAAYFRDIQWVRRALTVPPADSPYLVNDSCGSGRFGLQLAEAAPRQAGGAPAAELPAGGSGATAALAGGADAITSSAGSSSSATGNEHIAVPAPGSLPAGGSCPAKEQPVERQDVDIVFGHGGFRGLRLWMVLRMVRHLLWRGLGAGEGEGTSCNVLWRVHARQIAG